MGREPQEAHEEAIEEGSKAMSKIVLTREQANKARYAWHKASATFDEWSAVANALVEMGVLVEPTAPATGPTIEERLAALEAKANRPASEPFVPEQVTRAKLNATSLYEISQCANALENLSRAVGDVTTRHMETQTYWAKKLRELVDRHMRHGADVVAEAMKPDPKPTPKLIEACAEAGYSAHGCAATWEKTMFKEEWLVSTRAAITRFLEDPVRHKETDRACDAYLDAKENEGGVIVNLVRMGAALNEYRRVLLERVKGGV